MRALLRRAWWRVGGGERPGRALDLPPPGRDCGARAAETVARGGLDVGPVSRQRGSALLSPMLLEIVNETKGKGLATALIDMARLSSQSW